MPLEVFYSYSHKDEELRDELEKHLSVLKRNGLIVGWHDRAIGAGDEWRNQIDDHVRSAHIILLLISSDFLASDYCYDVEMKLALERHEKREAIVIPIILRPVKWRGAPFAKVRALPRDGKPVTSWPNRDEAFADIARRIGDIVKRFQARVEKTAPAGPSLAQVLAVTLTIETPSIKYRAMATLLSPSIAVTPYHVIERSGMLRGAHRILAIPCNTASAQPIQAAVIASDKTFNFSILRLSLPVQFGVPYDLIQDRRLDTRGVWQSYFVTLDKGGTAIEGRFQEQTRPYTRLGLPLAPLSEPIAPHLVPAVSGAPVIVEQQLIGIIADTDSEGRVLYAVTLADMLKSKETGAVRSLLPGTPLPSPDPTKGAAQWFDQPTIDRFSQDAMAVLSRAKEISDPIGEVHTVHLLLALGEHPMGQLTSLCAAQSVDLTLVLELWSHTPPIPPSNARPPELKTLPPMSTNVRRALTTAARKASDDSRETIELSDVLFGVLSTTENARIRTLNKRGVTPDKVGLTAPVSSALKQESSPARLAQSLLPGFSPEELSGEDRIGIQDEVNAFASVMAAEVLQPPLAIGLFGDWGSGKSFFMRKLQERIEAIAAASNNAKKSAQRTAYCNKIVQIEFNAWHYAEGNLWASLVEHIFENLRLSSAEPKDLVEERRKKALENLELSKEIKAKAQQQLKSAEEAREVAEQRLTAAKEEQEKASSELSFALLRDIWKDIQLPDNLKRDVKSAMDTLGLPQLGESAKELHAAMAETKSLLGRGRTLLLSILNSPGWGWRVFYLVLLVLAIPVVGWAAAFALNVAHLPKIKDEVSRVLQVAALLGGGATWVRNQLKRASGALQKLETANRMVDAELARANAAQNKEVANLEKGLADKRQEVADATRGLAEAKGKVAAAQAELDSANPTRIMAEFIEARAASTDYRRHLGIIALIRRDFETLTQLMRQRREESRTLGDDDILGIDRIILYIDDLDRCPPTRVVQVLEAIHLLLAFHLFVVVVGVDSRWVTRSLLERYPLLSAAGTDAAGASEHKNGIVGATPLDYLEKIFQIPFWLRRMPPEACGKLIEGIVGPVAEQPAKAETIPAPPPPSPQSLSISGTPADDFVEPLPLPHPQTPAGAVVVAPMPLPGVPPTVFDQTAEEPARMKLNLEPKSLRLERNEKDFMLALAPILSRSPRTTKRFINTYRIVRATLQRDTLLGSHQDPTQGPAFHAVMFLLSVLTGALPVADAFFECLSVQPRTTPLASFSSALRSSLKMRTDPEAQAICDWLAKPPLAPGQPVTVASLQDWTPYVARYSFRTDLWSKLPLAAGTGSKPY